MNKNPKIYEWNLFLLFQSPLFFPSFPVNGARVNSESEPFTGGTLILQYLFCVWYSVYRGAVFSLFTKNSVHFHLRKQNDNKEEEEEEVKKIQKVTGESEKKNSKKYPVWQQTKEKWRRKNALRSIQSVSIMVLTWIKMVMYRCTVQLVYILVSQQQQCGEDTTSTMTAMKIKIAENVEKLASRGVCT